MTVVTKAPCLSAYWLKAKDLLALWLLLNTDIDGSCPSIQSIRDKSWIKEKFEKCWLTEQKINTSVSGFIFLTLHQNCCLYHLVTEKKRCSEKLNCLYNIVKQLFLRSYICLLEKVEQL